MQWSRREHSILRRWYRSRGAAFVARLTGRSVAGVCTKAERLGLLRKRPWTDLENRRLTNWWGVDNLAAIARKLKRSECAVFRQAVDVLKLKRGAQAGQELLKAATRRTGYDAATLRRVLAAAGVKLKRPMSEPSKRRWRWVVESVEVDEAVAAWNATETVLGAARVREIGHHALRALLERTPGVPPKPEGRRAWRVPSEVIDRALAGAGRRAA